MPRKFIFSLLILFIISVTTVIFYHTQTFHNVFFQGEKRYNAGRYLDALPFLIYAHKIEPADMNVSALILRSYEKLKMKKKVKLMADSMWPACAKDLKVAEEVGDVYYGLNDYSAAEPIYGFISKKENKPSVKRKLAEVLLWQKNYDKAVPILEGLVSDNPKDFKLTELLADALSWKKDYEAAARFYKELMIRGYHRKTIMLKLADTLRYAGKNEEAIKLYKEYLGAKNE
jgi:predicted Zn-dependent protease